VSEILAFITQRDTHRISLLRVQFVQSMQREDGNLVFCPTHTRFRRLFKLLPSRTERLAGRAKGFCIKKLCSAVICVFNVSTKNIRNAVNCTAVFVSSKVQPSHSVRQTILF
jgi:hypothetical protein